MSEYLAIKNWVTFQSLSRSGKWIKDYTSQDDEPELCKLTMFQRGVYQELRRIRGRTGRNIPNDMEFILSAMSARLKDRPRIPCAIRVLTTCGLLVITNQRDDKVNSSEKEKEKEKEIKKKPVARQARGVAGNNSQRAKGTGEVRHSRLKQVVTGWYQDWAGAECPWNGGEAANLKRLIDSTPHWLDSQFVSCLDNLARSDCVSKGSRPREWLEKLPRFLHGPLDRYWKPKGLENGQGNSKTEQESRERTSIAVAAAVGKVFGRTDAVGSEHVPAATPAKHGNPG